MYIVYYNLQMAWWLLIVIPVGVMAFIYYMSACVADASG